jgi:hypothetical protein
MAETSPAMTAVQAEGRNYRFCSFVSVPVPFVSVAE